MVDYLVHDRTLLLIFPVLGAIGPAVWAAVVNSASPVQIAKTAVTQWTTLLFGTVLNLCMVVALGAKALREDATSMRDAFRSVEVADVVRCDGADGTDLNGPVECLRTPASGLIDTATHASGRWVNSLVLMLAIVVAAWAATGSARRGRRMQLHGFVAPRDRFMSLLLEFWVPCGLAYILTWTVYVFGRGITG